MDWLDIDVGARETNPSDNDQTVSDCSDAEVVDTKRKKKKMTFREKRVIIYAPFENVPQS